MEGEAREYYFGPLPSHDATGLPINAADKAIFGSLLVDANSSTPYTDATQVKKN